MGSGGAEGGEEPGEAAEPVGLRGEVEGRRGGSGGARGGRGEAWEGAGGEGGFERDGPVGFDGPAGGGDFDEVSGGVGEVDAEAVAAVFEEAGGDAAGDGEAGVFGFVEGAAFQVVEDGVEGLGGGDGIVLAPVLAEEPVSEGGGAEGDGPGRGDVFGARDMDEGTVGDGGKYVQAVYEPLGFDKGLGHVTPNSGLARRLDL